MFGIKEQKLKRACRDEIAVEFVKSIRARREAMGLKRSEVAERIGINPSTMGKYERYVKFPCLDSLIKLAEFFNVDISESINWKCYHGEIRLDEIRRDLLRYGISYNEAENSDDICGRATLYYTVHGKARGTLISLGRIIELINQEKRRERERNKMLGTKRRKYRRRRTKLEIQNEKI